MSADGSINGFRDHNETNKLSPSAHAMNVYLRGSHDLKQPHFATHVEGLLGLQPLSMKGRQLAQEGRPVVQQGAGDIAELGMPINDALREWMKEIRETVIDAKTGKPAFPRVTGEIFDYSARYVPQFNVLEPIARNYGITGPFDGRQVNGGRTIIDLTTQALIARWRQEQKRSSTRGKNKVAVILDPLAWPGYKDLYRDMNELFGDDFIVGIHTPVVEGHGLGMTAEGVRAAYDFAQDHGRDVIGITPILPSNPTGQGMSRQELQQTVEFGAEHNIATVVDALYSPIAPQGQKAALGLNELAQTMAPEALEYLGMITGVTKATSSQKKTGELFWHLPKGAQNPHQVGSEMMNQVNARMTNRNLYPAPDHALATLALHTFPGGIHEALGPRYIALEATRQAVRAIFDQLGIPFTIGGSFYGTAALADPSTKETYIRDTNGRPVTDPTKIATTLLDRYDLIGAQGAMFSPAQMANTMLRLSAAATPGDIQRLGNLLADMKHSAEKHG